MRNFSEFITHLKNIGFEPKTIIDVGVAWGTPPLYKTFPSSYLALIEALPYFEDKLKQILKKRKGEYHIIAASDEPGEVTINVKNDSMSLAGIGIFHGNAPSDLSYDVKVDTLDNILSKSELAFPMLLKLDVQGADLLALKGSPIILDKSDVVIVEASLFNARNLLQDIIQYMTENNFELYEIFGASYRPYDNALGQVDVAFVKEGSVFRNYKNWV